MCHCGIVDAEPDCARPRWEGRCEPLRNLLIIAATAVHPLVAQVVSDAGPTADIVRRDSLGIAGWYDGTAGHHVLVTWGPAGGYRLLDFDSAEFHRLEWVSGLTFHASGSGDSDLELVFQRGKRDTITGFTLRGDSAGRRQARRSVEYPFDQFEVRFANDSVVLGGLLMVPRVRKLVGPTGHRLHEVPLRLPAAVVIHGSGDSDRDNVWAFTIAQWLARAGIVTLFPDKRGAGASGGDWHTASFADLAEDALAAVAVLRQRPEVDSARIGLVGLSQGGWIAPLAASRRRDVAFVVDVSGAAVTPFQQMRHELEQDLARAGLPPEQIATVVRLGERALAYSRSHGDEEWSAYAERLAELSAGPLQAVAAEFPQGRDDWRWDWWPRMGDFDPVPVWAGLTEPCLVLYGSEDEHDNVPVDESVRRLQHALNPPVHPEHVIRVFDGTGHAFEDPETGWIRRDVLDYLGAWILGAVGGLDPAMAGGR